MKLFLNAMLFAFLVGVGGSPVEIKGDGPGGEMSLKSHGRGLDAGGHGIASEILNSSKDSVRVSSSADIEKRGPFNLSEEPLPRFFCNKMGTATLPLEGLDKHITTEVCPRIFTNKILPFPRPLGYRTSNYALFEERAEYNDFALCGETSFAGHGLTWVVRYANGKIINYPNGIFDYAPIRLAEGECSKWFKMLMLERCVTVQDGVRVVKPGSELEVWAPLSGEMSGQVEFFVFWTHSKEGRFRCDPARGGYGWVLPKTKSARGM